MTPYGSVPPAGGLDRKLQVFYCETHNLMGRARAGCPGCQKEIELERDNGYLRGWEDAWQQVARLHAWCGVFWGLKLLVERAEVRA